MQSHRSSFYKRIVLTETLHHRIKQVNTTTGHHRLRKGFAVLMLLASLPVVSGASGSSQEAGMQTPVTVRESVFLSTRTPLGEAVVRIAPGTQVSVAETKEDWILVKKPPFSAWIPAVQTSLTPAVTSTPTPAPSASPASTASPLPAPSASPLSDGRDVRFHLPEWIPASLIIPGFPWHLLLLAYGGFVTILLVILLVLFFLLRGTGREKVKGPQPIVSLEAKTPPLPGFVECPLCRAPLLIEGLTLGENYCPTCSGKFACE
jgi:hypothetical protein